MFKYNNNDISAHQTLWEIDPNENSSIMKDTTKTHIGYKMYCMDF